VVRPMVRQETAPYMADSVDEVKGQTKSNDRLN